MPLPPLNLSLASSSAAHAEGGGTLYAPVSYGFGAADILLIGAVVIVALLILR